MIAVRTLVGLLGVAVVAATTLSAIKVVVLPRAARSLIGGAVFRSSRAVFDALASERRSYETRDRILAMYAPVTLMALPVVWLTLVTAGYASLYWALDYGGWTDALWVSGSSLFTLGTAALPTTGFRVIGFTESIFGFGLVALLISYLPSLYGAFGRREQLVALLEVRAGNPPSAAEWLTRFHRIGWTRDLADEWGRWEEWFVDVEETHTSYPALVWFRSSMRERSWVAAAGTVLDAASLWLAAVQHPADPRAGLLVRAGFLTLRRIAGYFGVHYDSDPRPTDPISISRAEFDAAVDSLADAGLPVVTDRDQAWADFAGWRVNYDAVLLRMAELTVAPYTPWVSDRSAPDHTRPRVRAWGRLARRPLSVD